MRGGQSGGAAPRPAARAVAAEAVPAARGAVVLALLVTWLAFGSTFLAIKVALRTFPPLTIATINLLGAGCGLLGWSLPRVARGRLPADPAAARAARLRAVVLGTLLFFLGRGGVVWGTQYLPSGGAALLSSTAPLWVALLGRFAFGERLAPRALLGLAGGFAGVVLLVATRGGNGASGGAAGGGLALLGAGVLTASAISWATGSLLARRLALPAAPPEPPDPFAPLVSTAQQMLVGGTLMALASAAAGEWGELAARLRGAAEAPAAAWAAVAYLTVAVAFGGFTAFSYLLRTTSAALANTFAYVSPVIALFLGWAVLGERVTAPAVAASAVILGGVALLVTAPRAARQG